MSCILDLVDSMCRHLQRGAALRLAKRLVEFGLDHWVHNLKLSVDYFRALIPPKRKAIAYSVTKQDKTDQ